MSRLAEPGIHRKAEQPTVAVVIHRRGQVREDGRLGRGQTGEHLDDSALLCDEHPATRARTRSRWVRSVQSRQACQ